MDERKFPNGEVTIRLDEYSEFIYRLAEAEAKLSEMYTSRWDDREKIKKLEEENAILKRQLESLLAVNVDVREQNVD